MSIANRNKIVFFPLFFFNLLHGGGHLQSIIRVALSFSAGPTNGGISNELNQISFLAFTRAKGSSRTNEEKTHERSMRNKAGARRDGNELFAKLTRFTTPTFTHSLPYSTHTFRWARVAYEEPNQTIQTMRASREPVLVGNSFRSRLYSECESLFFHIFSRRCHFENKINIFIRNVVCAPRRPNTNISGVSRIRDFFFISLSLFCVCWNILLHLLHFLHWQLTHTTPGPIISLAFSCAHSWKHFSGARIVEKVSVVRRMLKKEEMAARARGFMNKYKWMTQFTCFARSNLLRFGSVILFIYSSLRFVLILLSKRISLLFICFEKINYAKKNCVVFHSSLPWPPPSPPLHSFIFGHYNWLFPFDVVWCDTPRATLMVVIKRRFAFWATFPNGEEPKWEVISRSMSFGH